jgi:hypothetical protein
MLLKEAYRNHTYPIRHMLKDFSMMRSFMTSVSLTWGVELDEGPDGSHTMPFHEENAVMMVYEGRPLSGRRRMSSPTPGPQLAMVEDTGAQRCNDTSFPSSQ